MTNFFLGLIAGCIIAGVVTISAARNPSVQTRLGLMPVAQAAAPPPAPVARIEPPRCPEAQAETTVGRPDMLFSRSRLWSIKP
ncbi:hypothetical protein [Methylorubrum salsuginis]|uniref:Uncharacterized protein n=1 Tax=Methylorubrum salsuginis TaxID=414703 RepID=A0A1I4BAP4_9HYPH|nr:hypothetical protein [Methylorubrum salsuginis]SFK65197.1 hypothetical protein SAMN04488125_10397 [Methylorubrum salsuginis]